MPTVVLDFGHGTWNNKGDVGAVGNGLYEYKVARQIGEEVMRRLPSNIKVVLTRKGDQALHPKKSTDLNMRCNVANVSRADLFMSIHLNSFNKSANGYETCVYQVDSKNKVIHSEIAKVINKHGLKDRGIKIRKDLAVLRGTQMSACLLECLFIDNASDMKKMQDKNFFSEFCQAIADGISKAVGVNPNKANANARNKKVNVVKNKGVEDELFNIDSPTIKSEVRTLILRLTEKDEDNLAKLWLDKFDKKTLTNSEMITIIAVALKRGLFDMQKQTETK